MSHYWSTSASALALCPSEAFAALTGADVCRLMRLRRVSIRALAKAHQITQIRVRELRARGVPAGFPAWEIHWMVAATAAA